MEVVGFLIFGIFAVVAIVLASMQAVRRRNELAAWAGKMGFTFEPGKDRAVLRRYPGLTVLKLGHTNHYADNRMRGEHEGHRALLFDFHYTINHGKSSSTHTISAAVLEPAHPLRPLLIRREGALDRVSEFFGMDDIDFESAEFSRTFYVKSDDRKWAYDVISPAMMEHLMTRLPYTLQMDDRRLVVLNERRWSTDDFEAALHYAAEFLAMIPPGVINELKGAAR